VNGYTQDFFGVKFFFEIVKKIGIFFREISSDSYREYIVNEDENNHFP